jgi:hypothetical protein
MNLDRKASAADSRVALGTIHTLYQYKTHFDIVLFEFVFELRTTTTQSTTVNNGACPRDTVLEPKIDATPAAPRSL